MNPHLVQSLERIHESLSSWSIKWGLSRLARDVDVVFAEDLNGDLGQCDLSSHEIRLHGLLLEPGREELLLEVLCHEAAHLVAYHRYGTGIDSHGPEWQGYMRKVGYDPRAVIREQDLW